MTEQEAKHTACCGPRALIDAVLLAGDRDDDAEPGGAEARLCLGRRCMAWRWERWDDPDSEVVGHGFCGLAGRPQ